jgi:hypothetical protein
MKMQSQQKTQVIYSYFLQNYGPHTKNFEKKIKYSLSILLSGGELLEMRLLDSHLLDTFGSKSIARHKFYQLLESS